MVRNNDGSKSGLTRVFGATKLCKSGVKADLPDLPGLLIQFDMFSYLTLFDFHTLMIRLAVKEINQSAGVSSALFVDWWNCSDSFGDWPSNIIRKSSTFERLQLLLGNV